MQTLYLHHVRRPSSTSKMVLLHCQPTLNHRGVKSQMAGKGITPLDTSFVKQGVKGLVTATVAWKDVSCSLLPEAEVPLGPSTEVGRKNGPTPEALMPF